jgi:hypothetical protein
MACSRADRLAALAGDGAACASAADCCVVGGGEQ